jgi:hypothetical protein
MNKHMTLGRLFPLMLAGAVVGACSRSPTAPAAPVSCAFVVTAPTSSFGPAGGNGSVSVEAPAGCGWSATTPADWIAIQGPAAGSGSGVLGVAVSALPTGAEARSGLITIAQQAFTLTQSACEFSLAPVGTSFGGEGGTVTVNLVVQDGCRWTVDEAPAWATVEPASGTGPIGLSLRVGENTLGAAREASVRVASARLAVSQAAQACGFSITPRTRLFAPAVGEALADVSTAAGCRWTMSADDAWVSFPGGNTGVGPGLVRFAVATNPGAPLRRTRLRLGDAVAELTQNGQDGCAVRLSAVEAFARLAGGTAEFTVSADAGCAWTAASKETWLRVLEGASGTGAGRVVYQVDPAGTVHASNFRMSPIEVRWPGPTAGENMWVRQFPCTALLSGREGALIARSPTGFSYVAPAAGGVLKMFVIVETWTGCPWTVQPATDSWTAFTFGPIAPAFERGDGDVLMAIAPNPTSAPRTTVVVIGESPLTITQAGQ